MKSCWPRRGIVGQSRWRRSGGDGEAGQRIQRRLAEQLVEAAAQEQGQVRGKCPECGGKLRYKGQKARWVATTSGEVKVERGYFCCEICGQGIFPLDQRWGLNESLYSPTLAQTWCGWAGWCPRMKRQRRCSSGSWGAPFRQRACGGRPSGTGSGWRRLSNGSRRRSARSAWC